MSSDAVRTRLSFQLTAEIAYSFPVCVYTDNLASVVDNALTANDVSSYALVPCVLLSYSSYVLFTYAKSFTPAKIAVFISADMSADIHGSISFMDT